MVGQDHVPVSLLDMNPVKSTVILRRHPRARHYTLRLNREGEIVVTLPRGGSKREAMNFVAQNREWIARHQAERATASGHVREWRSGTALLFRGRREVLAVSHWFGRPMVEFGDQRIFVADENINLRRPVEAHLYQLARQELSARTRELAYEQKIRVTAVVVRNQSSRWGSCSQRGEISLNWRLIQAPAAVRDYIVIHELMHRREMNHSIRFWRLAASVWPATAGFASPYEIVRICDPATPRFSRYCFTDMARRSPSARLYSSDPRSSQCPSRRTSTPLVRS